MSSYLFFIIKNLIVYKNNGLYHNIKILYSLRLVSEILKILADYIIVIYYWFENFYLFLIKYSKFLITSSL